MAPPNPILIIQAPIFCGLVGASGAVVPGGSLRIRSINLRVWGLGFQMAGGLGDLG